MQKSAMIRTTYLITALFCVVFSSASLAISIAVDIEIPPIKANPYHKPYVAVWLETPQRKGVHTLAFWREHPDWFKDLRQWWRKIGRQSTPNYDAVSGATRKPGVYTLSWDGVLADGNQLPSGEYVMHIEAVREQGSREYLRQPFLFQPGSSQHFVLLGKNELGKVTIAIK